MDHFSDKNLLKIKYHYDNLDNDQKLMKEIEDESKKPVNILILI